MKTRISIALIAIAIIVSFGAARIAQVPAKNVDMQASASPAGASLGGFAADNK